MQYACMPVCRVFRESVLVAFSDILLNQQRIVKGGDS